MSVDVIGGLPTRATNSVNQDELYAFDGLDRMTSIDRGDLASTWSACARVLTSGEFLMQDDVVVLFAYDRWANGKVLDACRNLTAEQYVAEPVPGWSSVGSTICHIAVATEFNLRTLAGDPDDSFPTEADLATVDDAGRLLERAYRRFEELRPTLTPEQLNALLTLRWPGGTATLPRWVLLRHIVNHASYDPRWSEGAGVRALEWDRWSGTAGVGPLE